MIIARWLIESGVFGSYYPAVYILNVFELWASSAFLFARFRRKKGFFWRLLLAVGISIGTAIGLGYLRGLNPDNVGLRMLYTYILYSEVLVNSLLLFEERLSTIVINWISTLAIREIADGVDTLIKLLIWRTRTGDGYIEGAHWAVNALICDLVHLAVQLPLSYLFARVRGGEDNREVVKKTVLLSGILLLVTVVTKTTMLSTSDESLTLYSMCVVLTTLLALMVLLLRSETLRGSQKSQEIATMNAVLEAEQRQFEESKQSIALINAKVHDIKHRLDEFGDEVASDTLNKLKESVSIYDRQFHTGSQVLDTVLYNKSLECDAMGIRLTAIADCRGLHYIPSSKRYYLFCNILDNAIEATKEVDDEEKRIVSLVVEERGENILIEECNYFKGERHVEKGFLETSKSDRASHGFGLRSISYFVEEYGGKMKVKVEEDMFFLSLSIPKNTAKTA